MDNYWGDNLKEKFSEITGNQTFDEWMGSGRPAGSLIADAVSSFDNKKAYVESKGIVDSDTQKYVEAKQYTYDLEKEIQRISQQEIDKDVSKPGYFKIGTVELTIPPTQIAISDVKQNYLHKTLRTSSDIVLQSGHSVKAVELDIFFHNIDDINNKLRPLLAQLKATPFVPIYSEYLRRVIYPNQPDEQTEELQRKNIDKISKCQDQIEVNNDRIRKSLRGNAKIMQKFPGVLGDLNAFLENTPVTDHISTFDYKKSLTDNVKKIMTDSGVYENSANSDSIMYNVNEASQAIKQQKRTQYNLTQKLSKPLGDSGIIAVLSQVNVATVTGFPESLACHASFFVFNYSPFSMNFEFLDSQNNPTVNIDECVYFVQWYTNRFLKPSHGVNDRYFKELPGSMNGKLKMTYTPPPDFKNTAPGADPPEEKAVTVCTDQKSVCVAISVSQRNSIAFLPVLQWATPTCQYMGAHNAEILVTIDTVDEDFIDRINFLVATIDWYSRYEGDKTRRGNFVEIENEILSFCGVKRGVINTIETQTVEGVAGMNRIQMSIIEFNPRQLDSEVLTGLYQTSRDMIMVYFKYELQKYLDFKNRLDAQSPPQELSSLLNSQHTYESALHFARNLTFGQMYKVPGALGNSVKSLMRGMRQDNGVANHAPVSENDEMYMNIYETSELLDQESRNEVYFKEMTAYLKSKIVNREKVDQIEDCYLDLLYDADSLISYKNGIKQRLTSFLQGNRKAIPRELLGIYNSLGLLKDELNKSVAYPDMSLPTYAETSYVGDGVPKPTNTNLGKNNTLNPLGTQRVDSDVVEPDFYFFFMPTRNLPGVDSALRDFENFFMAESPKMVAEIIDSASDSAKKSSDKLNCTFPPDIDVNDPEESIEMINVIRDKAIKLKMEVEPVSLDETSSEESLFYSQVDAAKGYYPQGLGAFDSLLSNPGLRSYISKKPNEKKYSWTAWDILPDDSGRNLYGGYAKDASYYAWMDSKKKPSGTQATVVNNG